MCTPFLSPDPNQFVIIRLYIPVSSGKRVEFTGSPLTIFVASFNFSFLQISTASVNSIRRYQKVEHIYTGTDFDNKRTNEVFKDKYKSSLQSILSDLSRWIIEQLRFRLRPLVISFEASYLNRSKTGRIY